MFKKMVFAVAVACLLMGGLAVRAGLHQEAKQEEIDDIKIAARKAFMRGKLMSNQKIVEGLSIRNYDMIREGADAVMALTKGQHWFVLDSPEYKSYSEDMTVAAQRLHEAAGDKNLDAAALRYFDLTLTCLDCHRYIETQKY